MEETVVAYLKAVSWHLMPGYVWEDHESAVSEFSASQPRFEPDTFGEYESKICSHTSLPLICMHHCHYYLPSPFMCEESMLEAPVSCPDQCSWFSDECFLTAENRRVTVRKGAVSQSTSWRAGNETAWWLTVWYMKFTFPKTFLIGLFGRCGEEQQLLPLPAIEPWFLGHLVRDLFTILAAFLNTSMKLSNPYRHKKKSEVYFRY